VRRKTTILLLGGAVACGADVPAAGGAGGTSAASETASGAAASDTTGAPAADLPPDLPPVCDQVATVDRGVLDVGPTVSGVALAWCSRDRYFAALPAGSKHALHVEADGPIRLVVRYPDEAADAGAPLAAGEGPEGAQVLFDAPRSGEFAVFVETADDTARVYDLTVTCTAGCDLETTRFPIVFVHGWTGFQQIGPVDYFYDVGPTLSERGYPVAFPVLDPYNGHAVRGAQLADAIDEVLAAHRARKVDLVAHSQGGLDARYAISTLGYGDRVAALYTVATPHRGTPLADIALGLEDGPAGLALAFLLETIGAGGGFDSDAMASFGSLSEAFVQGTFNPENPDDPRVDYQSWMGRTCLSLAVCGDVVDAPIATGYEILSSVAGDNDGVVPVSSAPWGTYHGTVPADHFDEVGQVAGATSPMFDHRAFYLDRARDLRAAGH